MPSPNNQFEQLARDAADRIDASREMQQQLSLLPDETAPTGDDGAPGRTRGAGRAMSQMREWLSSRGMRLPEDTLAHMAGLASRDDAILTAMAQAEQVLTWAQDGAVSVKGSPAVPTMAMRISTFMQLYAIMLRAADALMPYGAPKATPDITQTNVTQIVVAGNGQASSAPAATFVARDVTPGARRIGPPPMPHQIEQNQMVTELGAVSTSANRRTDDEGH